MEKEKNKVKKEENKPLLSADEFQGISGMSERNAFVLHKKFAGQRKTVDQWREDCKNLNIL